MRKMAQLLRYAKHSVHIIRTAIKEKGIAIVYTRMRSPLSRDWKKRMWKSQMTYCNISHSLELYRQRSVQRGIS